MPTLIRFRFRASRFAALFAVLTVFASGSAAQAQLWQGPAALEIRAEGQGKTIAGGTVELVYLALDPPAGPPPVPLDSRGRALVSGLAEGMWRVSVSREGFMTYQAEVEVRRDEKPELVATFQQNVPGATHMMKVRIARGRATGPAERPPQVAERPAPAPAPRSAPGPAPAPTPAPSPEPREAEPVPAPEQAPTQAPEQAPQQAPEQAPQQDQIPDPVPAPDPAPAPAPPAAGGEGSVRSRSYADRTCYECKPNEASLSVERIVAAGSGCGTGIRDLLAQGGGGFPDDGCAVLRLSLPPGSRYTGYRYEIQERSGSVDCQAGRDCPGGGRWPADPTLNRTASGTTVSAAFENPGAGEERRAILTVYFTQ